MRLGRAGPPALRREEIRQENLIYDRDGAATPGGDAEASDAAAESDDAGIVE